MSVVVDVTWQTDSVLLDEVSEDGKHGDTSVLKLDVTKTVELGLVNIGDQTKRVVETERGLGTELVLEGTGRLLGDDLLGALLGDRLLGGTKGGSLGGSLGWSESSSGGEEGGDNDVLHFGFFFDEL